MDINKYNYLKLSFNCTQVGILENIFAHRVVPCKQITENIILTKQEGGNWSALFPTPRSIGIKIYPNTEPPANTDALSRYPDGLAPYDVYIAQVNSHYVLNVLLFGFGPTVAAGGNMEWKLKVVSEDPLLLVPDTFNGTMFTWVPDTSFGIWHGGCCHMILKAKGNNLKDLYKNITITNAIC